MKRRRLISAIVGILLAFVMAATAFVGPGLRHTHEGGEQPHSHSGVRAAVGAHDSAGTHSHSHSHRPGGHVHPHSHAGSHHAGSHSHVHIRFLGFEFTLPDFLAEGRSESAETVASNSDSNSTESTAEGSNEDTVIIAGPFTFKQLVQVLLLPSAPLPEHIVLPDPDCIGRQLSVWVLHLGRLRDAPESPPPEFV